MNFQYIERGFGANHFIRVDQTVYEVSASRFTLYGKTKFSIDAASVVTVVENQNLVFSERTPVSPEVLKANEYFFIRALQQNDYERRKSIATANTNYYSACRKANGARRAEYQRRGVVVMDNLKYWNHVKQVPTNLLKKIEYGYLKGKSDINPQWRLMAMTQAFGPVGHGWTYRITRTWSEACTDGNVMAFAEVAVKTKLNDVWGEEFFGIGGSTIVDKNKNGISANDEGYKKAVTDALGVAFKAVGVAADVYLGNFDGSKYLYDINQAYQDSNQQQKQIATSTSPPQSLEQRFKAALISIQNARKPQTLDKAIETFTGTQFINDISNACRARADQMGWNQNMPQQNHVQQKYSNA